MISFKCGLNLVLFAVLPASMAICAQQAASPTYGIFEGATDVGQSLRGSTTYDSATTAYRVTGAGNDMWGEADAFHFSWAKLSGDAAITADVAFPADITGPNEKAVLIFRQSLEPGSVYADVAIHADGHTTLQYRLTPNGKTEDITASEHGATHLRIERKGNVFTAYTASGSGRLTAFSSLIVRLEGPVYVGIGVCSHNADRPATVTFSHLSIERVSVKAK